MKKLFVAGSLLVALASVNPVSAATPHTASAPAHSWSGCYAGAHFGGVWSKDNITDIGYDGVAFAAAGTAGQVFSSTSKAILVGGQVGCDAKAGPVVLGIESDLGWEGVNGSALDPGTRSNTSVGINSGQFGDVAGRVGVPYRKALIYAKVGWAYYDGKQTLSTTSPSYLPGSNVNVGLFSGFAAGAGVEYHIRSHWSGKAEYLYYGFGSQTFTSTNAGNATYPFGNKLSMNTIQVGVNYQFVRRH
jgi:outer membrane immunogenic protein